MNQLTRGQDKRLMFVENKKSPIDGHRARIGWVMFSKTAKTIYYRGRFLSRIKGGGSRGNYVCEQTGEQYWVSGVTKAGSNLHFSRTSAFHVDDHAVDAYNALK